MVVDLTGTGAVAGDTLTVNWGGQAVTQLLVAGDITASSVTVTVPATTITAQGDGTFDVTATLTDAAGNPSANSAATSVTVDTVAPAVAITTIEGGDDLINAAEAAGGITVSGTAEIGSTLTVNGAAVTVDASGGWTTSVTPAGDGPLTVTAVATDAAGNTATATHALTVDTVAPAAPVITLIAENAEGGSINAGEAADGTPVVVGLTGTGAAAGDTLTINWGGQAVTHAARGGRHHGQQRDGDGAGHDDHGAGRGHVRRDGHADRRRGQPARTRRRPGDGRHGGAGGAGDHLDRGEAMAAASTPARPRTARRWWWT